jgi:choline kinase
MSPAEPATAPLHVVILAAGMGTRLGRSLPKPLTPLADGRSILRQQVDGVARAFGPDVPITAVIGFRGNLVMQAAPELRFTHNPDYASTNTSKSLLLGLRGCPAGGVLWLNGDVVFDPAVLEHVAPAVRAGQSFVCVDTATVADEEIKYTLDDDGYVRELSKTVTGGLGEAVGINHVAAEDRPALIEHLDRCADTDYFERAIETGTAAGRFRFRPLDISRFYAVEVDFDADLTRANERLLAAGTTA